MLPHSSTRLEPGTVLQDRYKIVSLIGRGGMGYVYLSQDLKVPGSKIAIKEMALGDPVLAEQIRESFIREARFLTSLRHESMPLILNAFSVETRQYMVMEFIEGQTLAQKIEADGVPSDRVALGWALELAQVLDYLHQQERPIVFRDLKPENVMITHDGRAKLIDFGLARYFDPQKSRDTDSSGTVGYTPPEQWEDCEQSDPRSDIFSLGATLYFLLSGKAPSPIYERNDLRSHRPDLDERIESIVIRCMKLSPRERFASTSELIGHFSKLLKGEIEPDEQEISRRKPLTLGLSLALSLAAIVLLFWRPEPVFQTPTASIIEQIGGNREMKSEVRDKLEQGQYAEATRLVGHVLAKHPNDPEAQVLRNNAEAALSGKELYRIPVVSSWHGDEQEGFAALFGWALAQRQLNRDRKADEPAVYLQLYNDNSEPQRLLEIVKKISQDEHNSLMIGPWTSQQALVIAPVLNASGLVAITPLCSDPRVLDSGPGVFCVSDTDANKTKVLAELVFRKGSRKAAVFFDGGRYVSRAMADLYCQRFVELGGEIVLREEFKEGIDDFSGRSRRAYKVDADCVFFAEYQRAAVLKFKESVDKLGWDVPLASGVAAFDHDLIEVGGETANDLCFSTTYVPDYANERQRDFQETFAHEFENRRTTHRDAQVYDSLRLAVEALDSAGPDRKRLREYLSAIGRETSPYQGVSGTFAPSLHLNARPAYAVEIVKGRYRVVELPDLGIGAKLESMRTSP